MNKYDSNILRLAVPSIVSNITVPLLGLVDIAIVGHMGGVGYIAAISVGTMAFNVMYWLLGFVRMSASGTTSQLLGARNLRGVVDSLACSMLVALSISLLLILFNVILFRGLMLLMSPTDEVTRLASIYFDICIWGAPAVLGVNALSGWFVGMQDTRTPMVVAILQNVVNIALSAYLVFVVGMKVEGVAYGTLVAQWTGFALAVVLLVIYYARLAKYSDGLLRLLSRCRGMLGKYFAVNRDIFLRTVCIVGVNLFFTAAGARQGEVILSANTILMTFFTLFSYVMDGFAFAGEALAGKYFGASNRNTLVSVCDRLCVGVFYYGLSVRWTFAGVLTHRRDGGACGSDELYPLGCGNTLCRYGSLCLRRYLCRYYCVAANVVIVDSGNSNFLRCLFLAFPQNRESRTVAGTNSISRRKRNSAKDLVS